MPGTPPIDLRSDTVTRPTPAMLEAMGSAELGDDVLGDDPSVHALQERVAETLGTEAALFVPSGTMANLLAVRAQTSPGDELIMHAGSHVYTYEAGGYAAINGCSIATIDSPDGRFEPEEIDARIRADNAHFPPSRLLVVENTHNKGGGTVWSLEQVERVVGRARERGLACHLDGARLWNASVAAGVAPKEYARHFDSVSVCFSKGLGAPVGSAVAGSRDLIARAHRARKLLGGGMRQAGLLAAAGLHALEHHVDRLAEDHANARRLAEGIAEMPGLEIDPASVETNMVFFDVEPSAGSATSLCRGLEACGVRTLPVGPQRVRAVCHLDVSRAQIERAIEAIGDEAARCRCPCP